MYESVGEHMQRERNMSARYAGAFLFIMFGIVIMLITDFSGGGVIFGGILSLLGILEYFHTRSSARYFREKYSHY